MFGRKKLAAALAGLTMLGFVAVPAIVGAAGSADPVTPASPVVAQDSSGDGDGHHRGAGPRFGGPRHHGGGMFAVIEQFGVDGEQLRDAMQAVREQFPEGRPHFERPLSDEDRAAFEAYAAERNAALASALGIDPVAFQAAIDEARDARMQEMEAHHSARHGALAGALGITVEELQAAMEQARATLNQ